MSDLRCLEQKPNASEKGKKVVRKLFFDAAACVSSWYSTKYPKGPLLHKVMMLPGMPALSSAVVKQTSLQRRICAHTRSQLQDILELKCFRKRESFYLFCCMGGGVFETAVMGIITINEILLHPMCVLYTPTHSIFRTNSVQYYSSNWTPSTNTSL